ncbi:hypothetical protein NXY28_15055 [Bacteroides thetaiotaomicron]|nr:hypothetical protein NXY28_15055 [Bacteroides thetaiotaomicron]
MGKSKRKVAHSKKEEEQAQRVVKIVFVSLIILALIMLIAYSFFRLIDSPQVTQFCMDGDTLIVDGEYPC